MPGELHEISVAIGELKAQATAAEKSRQIMHERHERTERLLGEAVTELRAATGALREVGTKLDQHIASDDTRFRDIEKHVDRARFVGRVVKWSGSVLGFGGLVAIWNWLKGGAS